MVTSLRNAIKSILGFQKGIADGTNPTNVTPGQTGTYSKVEVDTKMAKLLGNGDLPLSQYGDLGFSEPNVSSRYEGATTTYCPIVYQVEQDGSRNYLRNGMDGQVAGVYLCKMQVDANRQMTGYSPMATPWRPAWLPAGDSIAELLHGAPGVVAMRCVGTYNGKLPAGSSYFAISWGNATLNPALHTNFRVLTGLTQAGLDDHYIKGCSTLVMDNVGTGGYLIRVMLNDMSQPVRMQVLNLTSLTAASLTPATEVLGWTGLDCVGTSWNTAGLPITLATVGCVQGNTTTAYWVRDAVEVGFGPFQTHPIVTVLSHNANLLNIMIQHETWASRADGAQDRKVITRVVLLNMNTKSFTSNANTRGPVMIGTSGSRYTITGAMTSNEETGIATYGNFLTGWSQCQRTGEAISQSTQSSRGTCYLRYMPTMSTMWLNPWLRQFANAQRWGYAPNYPSALGADIGMATPTNKGIRVITSQGWADILSPAYTSRIPYNYPDGVTTTWAVDTGRVAVGTMQPTRTMTVMPRSGAMRHVGMAQRGGTGHTTVSDDNVRSGSWSVAAAVDTAIANQLVSMAGASSAGGYDFSYYRPGKIGHYNDPLVVVGYTLNAAKSGFCYIAIYEITASSGGTVTAIGELKLQQMSTAVVSGAISVGLLGETEYTQPMIMAEGGDFLCLCGASPWNMAYVGNSGQPNIAMAITATGWKILRQGQAHRYNSSDTMVFMPGLGPCLHNIEFDQPFAGTTMTFLLFGNTYATAGDVVPQRIVLASQAVYGSWNLYFSEEVRCQIVGVTGYMPKKTVDLRSIKANPASTTFYLYAKLTNGVFDYVVSATLLAATKTMVPIGTVVTSASQITQVNVVKTFSIDGFALSAALIANAIPAASGMPASGNAVINWPGVAV